MPPARPKVVPLTPREKRQVAEQRRLAAAEVERLRHVKRSTAAKAAHAARKAAAQARSERSRKGWRTRRKQAAEYVERTQRGWARRAMREPDASTVLSLAEQIGPKGAIHTVERFVNEPDPKARVTAARALDLHPDEWAEDMADEYGIYMADIYDEFFGYEPRYGTL